MSQALNLPFVEGITAGLIVFAGLYLVYTRSQKKLGAGILAEARAEADRVRAAAGKEVDRARSEAVLTAKMEAVQQREALEQGSSAAAKK